MNLLLDTHTLLWWLNDDAQLGSDARAAIADPNNTVFLSAVVVWEIRIKEALGKLEIPAEFRRVLEDQSFVDLPVTVAHAHALGDLPAVHRDPFDRMIVAQARVEKLTVATRDPVFEGYDVGVLSA